jgi:hypothetical protein
VRRIVLVILLAGTWISCETARAQTPSRGSSWYGWQLALADAGALGLALAPVDLRWRGATVTMGMTGLFINGSIVNMLHEHPTAASRSLLRLPAFLIGRLLGFGAGELFCQEGGCKPPLRTAGGVFGLTAIVLLDLIDAFEPTPWWLPDRAPTPAPGGRTSPLGLAPRSLPSPALTLPVTGGRF